MNDDELVQRITAFLDANYPCRCGDRECPGNYWEAEAIVDIVRAWDSASSGVSGRPD